MTFAFFAFPPTNPARLKRGRRRVSRLATRAAPALALGAALSVVNLAAADAHVHVRPDSTASGSYSALTFRVPNESSTAGTVKVAVQLPQDSPFLSVSLKPVPGWTGTAAEEKLPKPVESDGTTITKAVRTVTWTADKGSEIAPGQYQEFSMSVGPLAGPGTVLLPVAQSYSDGKVVNWDQPTPASGEEPENPAPELVVTAAAAGDGDHHEASAAPSQTPAAGPGTAVAGGSDGTARVLGGAALVVALAGLVVAVVGLRRRTPAA